MTDEELMQQALEALTAYDGTNGASQRKRVLAALRERLTQWDALDRMAENARELGLNYEPVHSTQISKVWWDLHGDKLMAERIDPATIYQKPKMQPCAGRNCGSTNPNLHSAECFEDYEKSTGTDSNRTWTQAHWTEYEHSIVAAEREAIAQSLDKQADLAADEIDRQWAQEMAAAVRARGQA